MRRCYKTGNPCGTDTWADGTECECLACQAWLWWEAAGGETLPDPLPSTKMQAVSQVPEPPPTPIQDPDAQTFTRISDLLRALADDNELLEAARLAIENVLIEWRDSRLAELGRGNGFAIREVDGTASTIIRFGPETGMRIGLKAIADVLEKKEGGQLPDRNHCLWCKLPLPHEKPRRCRKSPPDHPFCAWRETKPTAKPWPPKGFDTNRALEKLREHLLLLPAPCDCGETIQKYTDHAADCPAGIKERALALYEAPRQSE